MICRNNIHEQALKRKLRIKTVKVKHESKLNTRFRQSFRL